MDGKQCCDAKMGKLDQKSYYATQNPCEILKEESFTETFTKYLKKNPMDPLSNLESIKKGADEKVWMEELLRNLTQKNYAKSPMKTHCYSKNLAGSKRVSKRRLKLDGIIKMKTKVVEKKGYEKQCRVGPLERDLDVLGFDLLGEMQPTVNLCGIEQSPLSELSNNNNTTIGSPEFFTEIGLQMYPGLMKTKETRMNRLTVPTRQTLLPYEIIPKETETRETNKTNAQEILRRNKRKAQDISRRNETKSQEISRRNETKSQEISLRNETKSQEISRSNEKISQEILRRNEKISQEILRINETKSQEKLPCNETNDQGTLRRNEIKTYNLRKDTLMKHELISNDNPRRRRKYLNRAQTNKETVNDVDIIFETALPETNAKDTHSKSHRITDEVLASEGLCMKTQPTDSNSVQETNEGIASLCLCMKTDPVKSNFVQETNEAMASLGLCVKPKPTSPCLRNEYKGDIIKTTSIDVINEIEMKQSMFTNRIDTKVKNDKIKQSIFTNGIDTNVKNYEMKQWMLTNGVGANVRNEQEITFQLRPVIRLRDILRPVVVKPVRKEDFLDFLKLTPARGEVPPENKSTLSQNLKYSHSVPFSSELGKLLTDRNRYRITAENLDRKTDKLNYYLKAQPRPSPSEPEYPETCAEENHPCDHLYNFPSRKSSGNKGYIRSMEETFCKPMSVRVERADMNEFYCSKYKCNRCSVVLEKPEQ